jgi:LysR family transcriptional regulator, glycine cleavage system transcriptional activator
MSKPLPPLNALRAFEATARHLSFARAAQELAVTPAALSHQVRGLEDFIGRRLFERRARSIALTEAGAVLYPGLHAAFLQIRQSVDLLDRDASDRVLVVSAPPGFTAKWLAPRLYRFLIANPEIDTRISAARTLANFTADGVDIAIRNVHRMVPGLWSRKLLDIHLTPVASPRFIAEYGGLSTPSALLGLPLIHDDNLGTLPGMPSWTDWLAAAGVGGIDLGRGLRFDSSDHALEAAGEGAGVLLAQRELAHDDLKSGRLVAPFALELTAERTFDIVCPTGREHIPKVRLFADWLISEVERMAAPPKA